MITRRQVGLGALGLIISEYISGGLSPACSTPLAALGLDRFSKSVSPDKQTETLCAIDVALDQSVVPQTRNLVICADVVRITGAILMPALDVIVVARRLECASGASIDTTGPTGSPSYDGATAAIGPTFGTNGSDGRGGGDGRSGGKIWIFAGTIAGSVTLRSNGGKGGAAESGGDGAQGRPGNNWQKGMPKGEDGGTPGQGGGAGKPGRGGDSGAITVLTLDTSFMSAIASADPGLPGDPGKNGIPGIPGNGGAGGQYTPVHVSLCPKV